MVLKKDLDGAYVIINGKKTGTLECRIFPIKNPALGRAFGKHNQ